MPWAAIVPAVVGAGGAIAGAEISAGAQEHASDTQAAAAAQAQKLQQEALALKAQEYNNAMALYQKQYAANQNIRAGLLSRYGINVPAADLSGAAGMTPINLGALTAGGGAGGVGGSGGGGGSFLGPLALAAGGGLTLASLWNQGLGSQPQAPLPSTPGQQVIGSPGAGGIGYAQNLPVPPPQDTVQM